MDIENLIDNIAAGEYAAAGETFNQLLATKMNDALNQEKIGLASAMFNGEDPEDEDYELEDEDFDLDEDEYEEDEDYELEDED
jgi:hypothetical protein